MGRIDMQSGAALKGRVRKTIVLTVCTEQIVLRNPGAVYEACQSWRSQCSEGIPHGSAEGRTAQAGAWISGERIIAMSLLVNLRLWAATHKLGNGILWRPIFEDDIIDFLGNWH